MSPKCRNSIFSLLVVFGCLFLGGSGWSQTQIQLGPGSDLPVLSVERSDMESVEIGLSVQSLDNTLVETKGGPFNLLSLGEYGFSGDVGEPSLPLIREFIEIPYGAGYELVLSDEVYKEIKLADLGITNSIVPVQAPVPKIQGAREAASFVIDSAVYGSDSWLPADRIRVVDQVIMKGHRLIVAEISPLDYNPKAEAIRVLTSARISLRFSGADRAKTQSKLDRHFSTATSRLIRSVVLNGAAFEASVLGKGKRSAKAVGYLMISAPAFTGNSSLQSLISLRTSQGYDVTLVDTNTTGTSTTSIKNYIQTAYNTWNPAPEYILLIGDTNTIPKWTGSGSYSPATDLNYACVDGSDYIPDVGRGRFPVRSSSDLTNMCDKILAMASNQVKKAVFMASEDNYWISEGTHNFVISNYLTPDGWTSDKLYCHTYNATTNQVTNAFNDGRSHGCFSGHGSSSSWADGPYFSQSNVRALTNTVYPFVQSYSCSTGDYGVTEGFCETWVRDDHAATSFFGSSESSYWTEDDILEKQVFHGGYNQGHEEIGGMIDYGQYETYLTMGGSNSWKRMYYEMYNLMGDPAMKVIDDSGTSDPVPDIKVNGQDGPLSIPHTTALNVTISLDPGDQAGVAHDWWIFVVRDFNKTYWWTPPNNWTLSATPIRAHDGALVSFSNYSVANGQAPIGWYDFSFDIDTLNGNHEGTFSDTVTVQVY